MSRFEELSAKLAAKGAEDPDALAAYIGRKKYGKAGMAALAAAGRHIHGRSALALGDHNASLVNGDDPTRSGTPDSGLVAADSGSQEEHHSGPFMTRAQARARLLKSGVLL